MSAVVNRRETFRMLFVSKLICRVEESGKEYPGTLHDISIIGLFAEMEGCPKVGEGCSVDIFFEGDHSRLIIEKVRGKILRSDEQGVAIRFDNRLEWFILIPLYFHKICGKNKLPGNYSDKDFQAMVRELSAL